MSTVIFSDTHLTHQFEPALFEQLVQIISPHDSVVINGDFWDGYLTSFDAFARSPWQQLFPLLLQKNAVYIFGNHDDSWMVDGRVALFSRQQVSEHTLTVGTQRFLIEHGHRLFETWVSRARRVVPFQVAQRAYQLHQQLAAQPTPLGSYLRAQTLQLDEYGDRKVHEQLFQQERQDNLWRVLGHTHVMRFEREIGYLNPGRFTMQHPGHIVIGERGEVEVTGVAGL